MKQVVAPAIAELCEEPVTVDAYERLFAAPPTEEDVAQTMDLVRWFRRRYPTAKERFAYVRRKYSEWTRCPPVAVSRLR